jgi:mRNA-degrading endonuclease toxin of MazEF toxin-antitoxin module
MRQWDIFTWEDHPAVIVSHPDRVTRKEIVNVLSCTSQRAARPPKAHEVLLDRADGLDWETLCRCDVLYSVEKSVLGLRRGRVTSERQRQIISRVIQAMGWT